MKIAAFDLEIAETMEDGDYDWKARRPLGITCAAIQSVGPDASVDSWWFEFTGKPRLTPEGCGDIVDKLLFLAERGFIIATVNGVGFDFDVLAEESGRWRDCADLAINHHCDMMLMSVCSLGWRTGLDALANGAGVESKLKSVKLSDGSILEGMHGGRAPELWAAGEYTAVMAYLAQDVKTTLETAETAVERGALGWYSSTGRWWKVPLPEGKLPTVAQCLKWPSPDTSWMSDPPDRYGICKWALDLLKEGEGDE